MKIDPDKIRAGADFRRRQWEADERGIFAEGPAERTFIVAKEEYEQCGIGALTLEIVKAPTLDALALKLWGVGEGEEGAKNCTLEALAEGNGDGMACFLVRELLPDGTLGDSLLGN